MNEITAEDTGVFLVKTRGSEHLWNLDEGWYIRNPGRVGETNSELMRGLDGFNGVRLPLDKVHMWPKVGASFHVVLPPPRYFHQSSTIRSIERIS